MSDHPSICAFTGTPVLTEEDDGLVLRFDDGTLHSRMLRNDPVRLVLEYTRLAMGFLLFQPAPARIAMIGLGGGSLAKYCAHYLPDANFTAVEISPAVIALRDAFGVPPDGPHFRVLCEDGAEFVRRHFDPLDVLLVDGFDVGGHAENLCAQAFYDRCHDRLAYGGVLVVNLYADDPAFGLRVDRIWNAFAGKIVVVEAGESQNAIVFAGTRSPFPPSVDELAARRRVLEASHPVDLEITLRKILAYEGRRDGAGRDLYGSPTRRKRSRRRGASPSRRLG
ncbi:transferase [Candidatus Binatia bacterium]|nr:transferase [Candidatus Binatia bacterium]